jgi:hypothetical protein
LLQTQDYNIVMNGDGIGHVVMIVAYIVGVLFPIVLSGYHTFLGCCRKGQTTNENCKGILFRPYSRPRNTNRLWDPRG